LTSKNRDNIIEDRKPARINVFTTIDTIPPEKLEKLGESDAIKELLKNLHLRNFLEEIFKASNSWNAMKLAMGEPIFLEFANECSKVIEGIEEET
jgi:zinc finger HIT domain-containing protein 3